jgi:hypothetical protein
MTAKSGDDSPTALIDARIREDDTIDESALTAQVREAIELNTAR